jgi:pimeloyl-[acyl-carrier protein] synthase
MQPLIEPFSAAFQEDPYPSYHRLRALDPVHRAEVLGTPIWILTRYADITAVLRDGRFSAGAVPRGMLPREVADGNIFYKDPPDHTRLRNLVNKGFLAPVIERARARVQALAERLVGAVAERGEADVIGELAVPFAVTVVGDVLGVPPEDAGRIKGWSDDLAVLIEPTRLLPGLPRAQAAAAEFVAYMHGLIEERRGRPGDDLLSALIAAREAHDALTEGELIATSMFVLIAGHETMTGLIGNGLRALLGSPQELARLRAQPSLIETAVEELLRYDAPVQMTIRQPTVEVEIGGRRIGRGEAVCAMLGAGNRDPAQFPDPDRLDLSRAENRPLSFGHGPHYCVGAALARVEARTFFLTLLRELPGLVVAPDGVERQNGVLLRGLRRLRVRWTPGARQDH